MKLKNCPFCGEYARVREQIHTFDCADDLIRYGVGCDTKNCHGEFDMDTAYYKTPGEAAEVWNKRFIETKLKVENKRLSNAFEAFSEIDDNVGKILSSITPEYNEYGDYIATETMAENIVRRYS